MQDWLMTHHLAGILTGLATFLIIGLFHPLVIKGYYYFGLKCRVWFLVAGLAMTAGSILIANMLWSILLGVGAFSCFWSIKEVADQKKRVEKGWFPKNPCRE